MNTYEAEFYQLELIQNKIKNTNKSITSINELGNMINTLSKNVPWNMNQYSKCLYELKYEFEQLKYEEREAHNDINKILNNNENFLIKAKDICNHYIEPLKEIKYNPNKYTTQYRKDHYKQLNIDLFPEDKEAFVEAVKYNHDTIKNVLRAFILKYIEDTEKNKKKQK